jgi:DNA-binding transcriptional regulator YiaG
MIKWTAEKIKKLREELQMDQIAFAAALYTTTTTISRWENGHASPDRRASALLDQLFKKPGNRLLEGGDD